MRRGTTPSFQIDCDVDLTGYTIYLTVKQGAVIYDLTPSVEATEKGCTLTATLSQDQTLSLEQGTGASMQVRAIDQSGLAVASNIMQIDVEAILKEGVITHA